MGVVVNQVAEKTLSYFRRHQDNDVAISILFATSLGWMWLKYTSWNIKFHKPTVWFLVCRIVMPTVVWLVTGVSGCWTPILYSLSRMICDHGMDIVMCIVVCILIVCGVMVGISNHIAARQDMEERKRMKDYLTLELAKEMALSR